MITIDLPRALELLEAEVNERGADYVYETPNEHMCVYATRTDDGQIKPSCLVGCALVRAGVDVNKLYKYAEAGSVGSLVDCFGKDLELDIDRAAIAAFDEAQGIQDAKKPWGVALEAAQTLASLRAEA